MKNVLLYFLFSSIGHGAFAEEAYQVTAKAWSALGRKDWNAAIAQAAHDAMVALYPRQAPRLDAWLAADLARLPAGRSRLNGIDIGRRAAAAILATRAGDGLYEGLGWLHDQTA